MNAEIRIPRRTQRRLAAAARHAGPSSVEVFFAASAAVLFLATAGFVLFILAN